MCLSCEAYACYCHETGGDGQYSTLLHYYTVTGLIHRVYTRRNKHVLSLGSYGTDAHGFERGAQGVSKGVRGNGPGDGHSDSRRVCTFILLLLVLFFVSVIVVDGNRKPFAIHFTDVATGFWEFVRIEGEESVQLRVGLGWYEGLTDRGTLRGIAIRTSFVGF